jgi:hypothetical protein
MEPRRRSFRGAPRSRDPAATSVKVDAQGNAYVSGHAFDSNFPTTPGTLQTTGGGLSNYSYDGFVMKVDPTAQSLVYSNFFGGSSVDAPARIVLDSSNAVYATGITSSVDFPATPGLFNGTVHTGTCQYGSESFGCMDAFVLKLSPDGPTIDFAGVMGADKFDGGIGIALDASKNVYVTGVTNSSNFQPASNGVQMAWSGGSGCGLPAINRDPAFPRDCFDAFVVGIGGQSHDQFGPPLPTSEIRDATAFGVLRMTLRAKSYEWQFLPVAGKTFHDQGAASCH